ncbi:MAG: NAD(P)H-hydrate dehydratase [Gammaproteobacteria bacterium]|nr:NAD(P)H-hydrate dehydratase [Gammaproteobacteria bacterium]
MDQSVVLPLYTAAQSRAADARAISELGVTGFELMLRAGQYAFATLLQTWPGVRSITVLCGKGNNAGDGYVVAALARDFGIKVTLVQVGLATSTADAAQAVVYANDQGLVAIPFTPAQLPAGDVIVDALLGTGQTGHLREPIAGAVDWINQSGSPVLAMDLPTGLDADSGGPTGGAGGAVVRATVTTTFITRKIGQFTGIGREVCGQLCFDSLGVPESLSGHGSPLLTILPPRPPLPLNTYKHQRGHVVVCGGDLNMGGAVILAGEAAMRAGAGMVTVATRPEHRPAILARRPELMVVDAAEVTALHALLQRADCVVLGPGLGRERWGATCFDRVMSGTTAPVVLDADGLFHWQRAAKPPQPAVITPHIAEAAGLLGQSPQDVQANRTGSVRALVARTRAVAVLKGAGTLIADEGRLSVCGAGNPGMATAGMGDVLSGVIAAHIAAGEPVYEATQHAVLAHALAGDRAARRCGARAMLAGDVIDELKASS